MVVGGVDGSLGVSDAVQSTANICGKRPQVNVAMRFIWGCDGGEEWGWHGTKGIRSECRLGQVMR